MIRGRTNHIINMKIQASSDNSRTYSFFLKKKEQEEEKNTHVMSGSFFLYRNNLVMCNGVSCFGLYFYPFKFFEQETFTPQKYW